MRRAFAVVGTFALVLLFSSLATRTASAFCGFYVSGADAKLFNDATQVVLMREGHRTILAMQNHYAGPPEDFAMVVPVPVVLQKDDVKTLPSAVFRRIDALSAPRLVEYWEQDPCASGIGISDFGGLGHGAGTGAGMGMGSGGGSHGVKVEAKFEVGEYQIVILSAKDASGLEQWLRDEKYAIPAGAAASFRPYVQAGSKFFVAKVDAKKIKMEHGRAVLSPLRFHYDADRFSLPIRLGLVNSSGVQDLIVHVLARHQRFDVANYTNVTIPTNLDVTGATKDKFATMYTTLFDRTLEAHKRAVVTEYAWDARTCDPCPEPALTEQELLTLGADVLVAAPGERAQSTFGRGFVLTRLHLRYGKDELGEDLVFRAAPPITGGREVRVGAAETLESGATKSSFNNFQARYAIRHPWTGAIACEKPTRGIWGGPPNGQREPPHAATNLAFAPRGAANLAMFVRGGVPELHIAPASGDAGVLALEPAASASPSPAPAPEPAPSAATPAPAGSASSGKPSGCAGCRIGANHDSLASLLSLLSLGAMPLAIALLRVRRRRARR